MKRYAFILLIAIATTFSYCNKKDNNPSKSVSDLPANAQAHLENCSEGCKTYVQLASLGGQTYFYLGYNAVMCNPPAGRIEYLDITGLPVVITSDLHAQLKANGILLDEIYNCDEL
jgi:hypothetical protein